MKLIQSILTQNNCYKAGRKINPIGIVIHSIGCEQPSAAAFVRSWNTATPGGREVCVHGFIDGVNLGDVYQTLPWNYRSWSCGSGVKGSYNDSYIQVEICEPKSGGYVNGQLTKYDPTKFENYFKGVVNAAADLCAYLMKLYPSITVGNIVSHAEAHARGYASNHADVGHWWKFHNYDMDDFRQAVKSRTVSQTPAAPSQTPVNNQPTVKEVAKVKYLVVYGKKEDKDAAETLAYRLGCPVMDADIKFDYSIIENVYCVGAPGELPFTGYAKQIISGTDRYDTMRKVLDLKIE
jgi:N-acetylmuramoyl-L-alanine amidase CwlA